MSDFFLTATKIIKIDEIVVIHFIQFCKIVLLSSAVAFCDYRCNMEDEQIRSSSLYALYAMKQMQMFASILLDVKSNVFVKPNEQSQACLTYAMARKGRMKFSVFLEPNEQSQACLTYAMARKGRMKSNYIIHQ